MNVTRSARPELLIADRPGTLRGAFEYGYSKRDLANLQPGVVRHL